MSAHPADDIEEIRPRFQHPAHGAPVETYSYERIDGTACVQAKYRNSTASPKHCAWWITGSDRKYYLSRGDIKLSDLKPFNWSLLDNPLTRNEPVILCEGPKDAMALVALGFVASDHKTLVAEHVAAGWYTGRDLIVVADRDPPAAATNGGGYHGHPPGRRTPGQLHARRALTSLKPAAKRCVTFEFPGDGVKDATDWVRGHPGTPAQKAEILRTLFRQALEKAEGATGMPRGRATLIEAIRAIAEDPTGRTVRRNVALGAIEHADGRLADSDVIAVKVRLHEGDLKATTETTREALEWLADRRAYHPVTEGLDALPEWDGEERLREWLTRYLHTTASDMTQLIGERFLIGMVARGMQPGTELHHALLLHGPQGVGKSTVAKIIGGPLYGELGGGLNDKDTALGLRGKLLVEISELGPMRRSEMEIVKAFLSRSEDELRAPYGRLSNVWPRSCSFLVTTNDHVFLSDPSGGRRFWPIEVPTRVDLDRLADARDQLLAEAIARWRDGAEWWPSAGDEAKQLATVQDELQFEDPWQEPIDAHVALHETTTIQQVFNALNVPMERQDQRCANRIAACLRRAGLERRQRRVDGRRAWIYELKDS